VSGYDDIAPGGGDTAHPLIVAARLRIIENAVPLEGRSLLDGGCGAGGYVTALRARGIDAHGVEFSADKVAEYQQRSSEPDRVQVGDLAALAFPDGRFDVALLNEVLEHVPDEATALREIHRVLRPGGTLIVFSPNRLYPVELHGVTVRATGTRIAASRAVLVPYIPLAVGKHLFEYPARNYWPRELRRIVRDAGFTITDSSYVWQTFENISGTQPRWLAPVVPLLRRAASVLQEVPVLRSFGVSQVVVARRG
jgi:SAM-dependent methyltransferase